MSRYEQCWCVMNKSEQDASCCVITFLCSGLGCLIAVAINFAVTSYYPHFAHEGPLILIVLAGVVVGLLLGLFLARRLR